MNSTKILFFLTLLWCVTPMSFFYGDFNKVIDNTSQDGKYKVTVYRELPLTPYSLYKYLKDKDYYFVLFRSGGEKIFKPSIFYGTS